MAVDFDSDGQKSCNDACEKGALDARQFFLDKVSRNVLTSGAAGKYINIKENRIQKREAI